MSLPSKIEVCPIIDAVVEIRFTSDVPASAMLGLIYRKLESMFKDVVELPITQMPEQLRSHPDLAHQPYHELIGSDYKVRIGPQVISIIMSPPYRGWVEYSSVVYKIIEVAIEEGLFANVSRLGLRYINGFREDMFELMNVELYFSGSKVKCNQARLKNVVFEQSGFISTVQVFNETLSLNQDVYYSGIDIDVMKNYQGLDFRNDFKAEIEAAHRIEKEHFFRLVDGKLLEHLKPQYDE